MPKHLIASVIYKYTATIFEVILILLLGLSSCNSKFSTPSKILSNDICIINMPDKYTYVSNLDSLFSQIIYIPLQTTKECILSNPKKVIFKDMKYYVLDFRRGIYVFDQFGKFLHQIGKIGRGPGELIEINDFDFDDQGNVLILDSKRILRYKSDGSFLETYLKFDFVEDNFYANLYQFTFVSSSEIYAWGGSMGIEKHNPNQYAMYKLHNGRITQNYFPLNYKLSDKQHRFLRVNSKTLINPVLGNDTIYSIKQGTIHADYYVDFNHKAEVEKIPSKLNSISDFGLDLLNSKNISFDILNPLETSNWLTFTFTYQKKRIITLYDKKKSRIYTIKGFGTNSTNTGILMPYYFNFMQNNFFCSIVPASHYLKIKSGIEKSDSKVKCKNTENTPINIDDNFVIIKYKPL